MSISSTLTLKMNSENYNGFQIFCRLLNAGWVSYFNGETSFLPIGADDFVFESVTEPCDEQFFKELFREKQKFNEDPFAVSLMWEDTGIGGEFFFYSKNCTVYIGFDIDRRAVSNCQFLDLNWYANRILPHLNHRIETYIFEECFL